MIPFNLKDKGIPYSSVKYFISFVHSRGQLTPHTWTCVLFRGSHTKHPLLEGGCVFKPRQDACEVRGMNLHSLRPAVFSLPPLKELNMIQWAVAPG